MEGKYTSEMLPLDVGALDRSGIFLAMDKKLAGMPTTDKIGSRRLVHSKKRFKKLFMISFSGGNRYIYGDNCGSKAQDALHVAHYSVPKVDKTIVEEGVEKIRQPHV